MPNKFGQNLKKLRLNEGISQNDLAQEFKVSLSTISFWENDKNFPEVTKLIEIAEYFNVSADSLLGLEPPPTIFAKTPALEPDERKLLEAYHELTPGKKKALFQMLDIHTEIESNKKKGG